MGLESFCGVFGNMASAHKDILVKTWILLFAVQTVFSFTAVLGKKALQVGVDPLVFALYREIFGSGLMFLFVKYHNSDILPARQHIKHFLFLGFLSFANIVGFIVALKYITAFNSALLHPTIPVFAKLFSVVLRVETISFYQILGILLCGLGALFVVWESERHIAAHQTARNPKLGNFILILQCMSMGALIAFQKPMLKKYSPYSVTLWFYFVGSILTVFVCFGTTRSIDKYVMNDFYALVALFFGSIFGIFFNYVALTWANKQTSPSVVASSMTLQPIITAIVGFIFLHEEVTWGFAIGGTVIVIGLFMTTVFSTSTMDQTVSDDETKLVNAKQDSNHHDYQGAEMKKYNL